MCVCVCEVGGGGGGRGGVGGGEGLFRTVICILLNRFAFAFSKLA